MVDGKPASGDDFSMGMAALRVYFKRHRRRERRTGRRVRILAGLAVAIVCADVGPAMSRPVAGGSSARIAVTANLVAACGIDVQRILLQFNAGMPFGSMVCDSKIIPSPQPTVVLMRDARTGEATLVIVF